ncbi:MAG: glycosyltransferase family 2 protein [Roseibium sp.]|uniref:glycosyltransferase family 2 protein n=1 Tax=Roseibium sp. TaxID=1936156 RepID=UPI001B1BAAAE|nr:glycosyltransferase family A protein [Roseibium sp.]MBO6895236.1 glycosyltransferase family 2 protein [Roseibium sp.]MBO6930746.1 glycosyltransferase family 2 protein [Roseibium sp.]
MSAEKLAPRVSVIVPVYNAEAYLPATVNSVFAQSFEDYELILVDDGSTDRSSKIAQSFSDPRVRYHRQENHGVSTARNKGLDLARGSIIGFLDSDDLWHRDKIAEHVGHFDRRADVGVSYSACRFIDSQGNRLKTGYRPKLSGISAADVYCRNPIAGGSTAFFRREIFDDIVEPRSGDGHRACFDVKASAPGASHAEDHQCWLRMALHSRLTFEGIDKELTFYRIHDAGLSARIDKMHQGWLAIDAYVRDQAPDLHKSHSSLANAYQMRYFARRSVARGDSREAASYLAKSLRFSLKPFFTEPVKSLSTLAAVLALRLMPSVTNRWINRAAGAGNET